MADLSDVETALVGAIVAAAYPAGIAAPSAILRGGAAATVRVYRGWPNAAALDADLAQGVINISVYPEPQIHRVTTRFPDRFEVVSTIAPTLAVTVSGRSATFTGIAGPGQFAGLIIGLQTFPHVCQSGDTPASIAAALAAAAQAAGTGASASGATVTVPGSGYFAARAGAGAAALREVRRQVQGFRISFWCPDPASRDTVVSLVDAALAAQNFLTLADGSSGRLLYVSAAVTDSYEEATLYRRDLLYSVEYPTTLSETEAPMLFGVGTISNGAGVIGGLLP